MAAMVTGRADSLDAEERRTVLEMIDTRVEVTAFPTCAHCAGSGREAGTAGPGNSFGDICTVCSGMRRFPELSVKVTVPDELLASAAVSALDVG
ncbi:MAG: hypothetical protein WKF57_04010 [Nakamurella sp.]